MYRIIRRFKRRFSYKCTESIKFTEKRFNFEGNEIYLENCSDFVKLNKENLLKNSNKWRKGNFTKQGKKFLKLIFVKV